MVNKEMKFLDNGDIRYEVVDEAARSNIQTINTVLETKADTSNVTALDTRVTGVEDDCYNSYAVGTASGAVASFSDGADDLPIKSLMVDINPVQDLHGQDAPYPAGGGKNLWNGTLINGDIDIDVKVGVTYTVSAIASSNAFLYLRRKPVGTSDYTRVDYVLANATSGSATFVPEEGYIYSLWSNQSYSLIEHVQIEVGSTATTYAPYENICPISGWTGCEVRRSGKNLLPFPYLTADGTYDGITYTTSADGKLIASGTTTQGTNFYFNVDLRLKKGTYTISIKGDHKGATLLLRDVINSVTVARIISGSADSSVTFTVTEDVTGYMLYFNMNSAETVVSISAFIQLELGATATDYEPYQRQTISINWESETGTVYGGKLDVITGELTVDRAMVTLDGSSDEQWALQSINSYGIANFNVSIPHYPERNYKSACNMLAPQVSAIADTSTEGYYVHQNGGTVYIRISVNRASTVNEWRTWLAQNNIQLVYSLAEAIEIQLSPTEVKSLLGQNNIFANTGDVDVEYRADTTLYIERLIESNVDRAEEAKIDAQNSATQAEQSATNAQTSAQTASSKASEASTSASQALTYKTDTESARDEVQSIVDSISANASQIDTNTENIASLEEDRYKPYVTDSTSGAIASFTDGADDLPLKSLVVNIDPVQDLHGYDSPWVAGGGRNLFDVDNPNIVEGYISDLSSSFSDSNYKAKTVYIPISPNTTYTVSKMAGKRFFIATSPNIPAHGIPFSERNANNVATSLTVTSGADDAYLWAWVYLQDTDTVSLNDMLASVQIEEGSTPTAYAPYSNICPISGWTQVDVEQSGKNLYNPVTALLNTWINLDTGEIANGANGFWTSDFIPVKPSVAYTKPNTDSSRGAWYDANKNWISATNWTSGTKTAPTNARYVRFCGQTSAIAYNGQVQFEEGSTATPYSPYTGRSITIQLGQTVYGGKLDVLTGVLTVDRAMVDLGTLNWNYVNGASGVKFFKSEAVTNAKRPSANAEATGAIFSTYATIPAYDVYLGNIGGGIDTILNVRIYNPNYTDATAFKAAMSGVQLCYELAEPLTIQLTPHEVKTLLGQNNIWADTGDSEVEYRADTKLYIERLTAPDSVDMIADSNIVSGQYFMVSNALYKATANIANGGQIIVGTNCTKVSLATALNEINA